MKKNTAIVILVIIVLGLVGYIVYDKITAESRYKCLIDDSEKAETVENKNLDINDDIVVELFNTFRIDNACYKKNISFDKNTERLRLAYESIQSSIFETKQCSDIGVTTGENGSFCGSLHEPNIMNAYIQGGQALENALQSNMTKTISSKAIEAKYKKLFGADSTYKTESFGIGPTDADPVCFYMNYIDNKDLYAEFTCEGGGTCALGKQEIVSAKLNDGTITMETKYTLPDGDEQTITYEFTKDSSYGFVFNKMKRS